MEKESKWEANELRLLVGIGGAFLSYLGLGLALWVLYPSVLAQVAYALGVFAALLLMRLRSVERKLIILRREAAETIAELESHKTLDGLAKGMLGLALYLKEPPRADTR